MAPGVAVPGWALSPRAVLLPALSKTHPYSTEEPCTTHVVLSEPGGSRRLNTRLNTRRINAVLIKLTFLLVWAWGRESVQNQN